MQARYREHSGRFRIFATPVLQLLLAEVRDHDARIARV
jgi:hypothetical protein